MVVLTCIILIGICTLGSLTVSIIRSMSTYGKVEEGWFWIVVAGIISLTVTIITLCNTVNWK